jgi:hypothetical protein
MIVFDEECYYDQGSTGIMSKKETRFTEYENDKCAFVD